MEHVLSKHREVEYATTTGFGAEVTYIGEWCWWLQCTHCACYQSVDELLQVGELVIKLMPGGTVVGLRA